MYDLAQQRPSFSYECAPTCTGTWTLYQSRSATWRREVLHIATRCVASALPPGHLSAAELCDRHALYVLGWYDTIIGPPLVPLPPDEDEISLMQLSTAVPPEEHCPWFLLRTRQCFIDAWEQPCPSPLKWSKARCH